MLTCAEDDQGIRRDFSLIYLISDAKNGYNFPERDRTKRAEQIKNGAFLPNAAVCHKHLREAPLKIFRESHRSIDKEAYAVYTGIDEEPWLGMGYVCVSSCSPDITSVRYISGENMQTHFPNAQKVILEYLLDQAVLKFENVDTLFRRHNEGILRHFSDDQKERYQLITRAEQLERASKKLDRDMSRF